MTMMMMMMSTYNCYNVRALWMCFNPLMGKGLQTPTNNAI